MPPKNINKSLGKQICWKLLKFGLIGKQGECLFSQKFGQENLGQGSKQENGLKFV